MDINIPPEFYCKNLQIEKSIFQAKGIYIGELHGTNETPKLVECIVRESIKSGKPVIVSIEMPPCAIDEKCNFWNGKDGRASYSMKKFVSEINELQRTSKNLEVDFMGVCYGEASQLLQEKCTGEHINSLTSKGFVIAYGGNFHAMRKSPPGLENLATAGSYVSKEIITINIGAKNGGSFWGCAETACGIQHIKKDKHCISNSLIKDYDGFYDYKLCVRKITFSKPSGKNQ